MPHATWKGHISFGLVSIPIILFSVEDKSKNISFRQIDKRNHARVKNQRINAENGKLVPWEEIAKGYEYSKDEIIIVDDKELKKVAGDNARTIAIETFIDKKHITFINVDRAYYLVPDKKGEKGYIILREALKASNKIGIAKVIISTKEYLSAVAVFENALVLYTLHYHDEIRSLAELTIPSEKLASYQVNAKEIDIAKQLIQSMTSKWEPEKYKDEFREAVHHWVEKKLNKMPGISMKSRSQSKTKQSKVDFIQLLKKSLQQKKPHKKAGKLPKATGLAKPTRPRSSFYSH